jgi:carotenoid cleavage dioxygenase-like enzyme
MTKSFNGNVFLEYPMGPAGIECDAPDLVIEGELPKDLEGCYYRNGPDPLHPPREGDQYHWFDGDGMIQYFRFENGRVSYRNRWVQTEKYKLEREAGESLFGVLGNPMTGDPSVADVTYNTANTSIVKHAGKMLALMEGALPVEIKAHSLETIGSVDFNGRVNGPVTAHPKFDADTGEMFFFGYQATGLASKDIRYNVADKDGNILVDEMIEAPFSSMIHDFFVTKTHIAIPIFPLTFTIERAMEAGNPMAWEPDIGTHIGVMPRYGKAEDIRWHKMDARFMFHMANAWDEGDKLVAEVTASDATGFAPMLDGTMAQEASTRTCLRRWTIDVTNPDAPIKEDILDDLPCEFPRIDDRLMTKESRHIYASAKTDKLDMQAFNSIVHYDRSNGKRSVYFAGNKLMAECVFVNRRGSQEEGDGYILALAHNFETRLTEMLVLDASSVDKGPLAVVKLPLRIPPGFHGIWLDL